MVKIGNFTVHSDFPSLANDAIRTMSITIPDGWTVGQGHSYLNQDYVIGSTDSSIRAKMSVDGTNWYIGTTISWYQNVNYVGIGDDNAAFVASIYRVNPTTLRLQITVFNNNGTNIVVHGPRTIRAEVGTFVTPF